MSDTDKKKTSSDEPTSFAKAIEPKLLVNRQGESSLVAKVRRASKKLLRFIPLGHFASSLHALNNMLYRCFRPTLTRKDLEAIGGLSLEAEYSLRKSVLDFNKLTPTKNGPAASFLEMHRSVELVSMLKESFSHEIDAIKKEKTASKPSLLKKFLSYYNLFCEKQSQLEDELEELENLLSAEYRQAAYIEDQISVLDYLKKLVEQQNVESPVLVLQDGTVVQAKVEKSRKVSVRSPKRASAPALQSVHAGAAVGTRGSSFPPFIIDEPEISLHGQKMAASIADRFRGELYPIAINIFNINVGSDATQKRNGRITLSEEGYTQIMNAFMAATGKLLGNSSQMAGFNFPNQVNTYLYPILAAHNKDGNIPPVEISEDAINRIADATAAKTAKNLTDKKLVKPPKFPLGDPDKMTNKQKQQHDIRVIRAIQSFDANTTPSSTIGIEEAARRAGNANLLIWYKNYHTASVAYRKMKNNYHEANWAAYCYSPPEMVTAIKEELEEREAQK